MWDKHWERVDSFLKKWKMVQEGDSILLGISGGADSVCLARYFLARREALSLKLYAVHINHMLRGEEAKRDEVRAGFLPQVEPLAKCGVP